MKNEILAGLLTAVMLFGSGSVCAKEESPVRRPTAPRALKVLMIGNSFSICVGRQMPQVAASMGLELDLCSLYIGGCPLSRHDRNWRAAETNATFRPYRLDRHVNGVQTVKEGKANIQEALALADWDVITFQQASCESWREPTYHPWADDLQASIRARAPKAEFVWQETWSYCPWDPRLAGWKISPDEMYAALHRAYTSIAASNCQRLIPTGTAIDRWRKELPVTYAPDSLGGDLVGNLTFTKKSDGTYEVKGDRCHLNGRGEYLQALVWTAKLFGADVRRCTYKPDFVTDEEAARMKRIAVAVVADQRENALRRRPPRCAFVSISNTTFDEPKGRASFLSDIEMLGKGGYDLLTLTLRCRPDLNAPEVRSLVRDACARAHACGLEVSVDVDPRIARAKFLADHPDAAQQALHLATAKPANGAVELRTDLRGCGDHMTGGTTHYVVTKSEVLKAWAIRRGADGRVTAREIRDFTAACEPGGAVRVTATGLAADEEFVVLQISDLFSCDVFSPHLIPYTRQLMADFRALGADAVLRDEWGFPPSLLKDIGNNRTFWYSRPFAAAYRAACGRDLLADALLFAFPLADVSAAERSAAVTAYRRLVWARNTEIECDFYDTVHALFGPQAFVAKHPTWYPAISWLEFAHNGLDWWSAKRDFAQTDETTPLAAACGMTKKAGGGVWLNEGYQANADRYAEMIWRYALTGGRMVFHPIYPAPASYRALPPVESATARHRDILTAARRARDAVAKMDELSSAPIDCPVAWVFSHARVAWDWTDPAYGDWGDLPIQDIWGAGFGVDAYPSTELASFAVDDDGYVRMGVQRYRALVRHHFSADDEAAFAKLVKGVALKTKVFDSAEGVAAFLAQQPDVPRQAPLTDRFETAKQKLGDWRPQNPPADGTLALTDGTRIRIKATEDSRAGDPISGELVLADGSRFIYAARGWFGANAAKVGGCGVTRIKGPGVDVTYSEPRDVILPR